MRPQGLRYQCTKLYRLCSPLPTRPLPLLTKPLPLLTRPLPLLTKALPLQAGALQPLLTSASAKASTFVLLSIYTTKDSSKASTSHRSLLKQSIPRACTRKQASKESKETKRHPQIFQYQTADIWYEARCQYICSDLIYGRPPQPWRGLCSDTSSLRPHTLLA